MTAAQLNRERVLEEIRTQGQATCASITAALVAGGYQWRRRDGRSNPHPDYVGNAIRELVKRGAVVRVGRIYQGGHGHIYAIADAA